MKIAIITSFRKMPESYSLVNDVRDQIKTLKRFDHEVVFFAQKGCDGEGIDCETKAIFPHFKMEKNVVNEEIKNQIKEILEKELIDFDVAITHDLTYLEGYITYRKAIMESQTNVRWIHWCHSGVGHSLNIKMPHAKYIYMNYTDIGRFAKSIGVEQDDVRVVFNDKDPELFFKWHKLTKELSTKIDLFNRDIIQTYPMCSTRMDSKGINHVIKVFGRLKALGNNVLLIICNSNGRRKKEEIQAKLELGKAEGLDKNDFVFTSEILGEEAASQVPRAVVRDLMYISNLFVFPSVSEVCSNVLLEASMCKQLLVLNKDFPALFDFGEDGKTVLSFHFGSLLMPGFKFRDKDAYTTLAKVIVQQLKNSKSDLQMRRILRDCNLNAIYRKQLEPILYEKF
jgi:glycosyltransferase involved in cell wall biosynthesis